MRFLLVLLALSVLACSHVDGRTRLRRVLVGAGATSMVFGALALGGCVDNETGCGGGPDDANLAAGIPLLVGGAALVTTGALMNSKGSAQPASIPVPQPVPSPQTWPSRGYGSAALPE